MVCGDLYTIAVADSGKVYGWGKGISRSESLIKSLKETSLAGLQNSAKKNGKRD